MYQRQVHVRHLRRRQTAVGHGRRFSRAKQQVEGGGRGQRSASRAAAAAAAASSGSSGACSSPAGSRGTLRAPPTAPRTHQPFHLPYTPSHPAATRPLLASPRPGPRIARLRRQEDLLPSQRPRLKMTLQHRPLRKQPVRSIRRNDFRCGDCVCAYDRRLGPVPLGRVEVPYNLEPPQLMSRGTLEMKLWEVAREGGRTYDSLR